MNADFLTAENAKKTQSSQRNSLPWFRMPLGMHRLVEKCVIRSIACRRYATCFTANGTTIKMLKNIKTIFVICCILMIFGNSSLVGGTTKYDNH